MLLYFTPTETIRTIKDVEPRTATSTVSPPWTLSNMKANLDFHTAPEL